ncbi:hypothetical protein J3R83DRAFT_13365 [Lanmaoa asiatica]|nr:hypothetical protein J3R83DRAFT_13365 [Lanmaoa asiatica]
MGDDLFRTKQVSQRTGTMERRNCYVKFEVVFEIRTGAIKQVNYGDLKRIYVLTIPEEPFFGLLQGKTFILALVTPWDTDGKLASKENVYMTMRKASVITDIRSLKSVVGLVETRGQWGIIDRSLGVPMADIERSNKEDDTEEDAAI